MKLPGFLRGMPQVFLQELLGNVKSIRFFIMALVAALVIVGGAYGISGLSGGFGLRPFDVWAHPATDANGDHIAVAWVADPFGRPQVDRAVVFQEPAENRPLGEIRTDADGFARLNIGTVSAVMMTVRSGTAEVGSFAGWDFPLPFNFTYGQIQDDVDNDGAFDDLALHVLDLSGYPVSGRVLVNGTEAGQLDAHGFVLVGLPPGESNLSLEVGSESVSAPVYVPEDGGPTFLSGPDFVLLAISIFSSWIVSIFAIVISFDAVSKERVHGTMDLLLSRPASRTGVLLGKFLASFAAVAIPVTLVNLAGIAMISAASGKGPTGSYASAFVGYSLLLIAYYVLLQLTLSTLAKTGGTAVLFGVLIWLLLNILYNIVVLIVAGVFSGGDPATYFSIQQYAALGNPSTVVSSLISLAAPLSLTIIGGTALDAGIVGAAAVFWFALLFALALWVFQKKAAE